MGGCGARLFSPLTGSGALLVSGQGGSFERKGIRLSRGATMMKRSLPVAVLALLTLALPADRTRAAGLLFGPYDFSLGPYMGGHGYSYNVAYGYGLPFTSAGFSNVYTFPY